MTTTPERRQVLYTQMLHFMKKHKANIVPVDLPALCASSGVGLVPLSRLIRDTGLSTVDIYAIWGNEDGAIHAHNGAYRIAYNDAAPKGRIRFTLCEELAHMVYGHTADPDFNLFRQNYRDERYAQYDEEARLGAGLLLCHPKFFYTYERFLTPRHLAQICGLTLPCATARREIYLKYRGEITANMAYQFAAIPRAKEGLRKYERACRQERLRA